MRIRPNSLPMCRILLLAVSLFWIGLSAAAFAEYKYPIGIPKAWIEPDVEAPARPDDWKTDMPGYYFVDWETGIDKGRKFGNPNAPRKSIPNPIPPGSRVEVKGKYLQSNGSWFITFAGNSSSWVADKSGPAWLIGTKDDRASFDGKVLYVGEYGCIDNVDNFQGKKATGINSVTKGKGRTGHHFLVRNCEFKGSSSSKDSGGFGINGNEDPGGEGYDIVFYQNEVHHFGVLRPEDLQEGENRDPDFIAVILTDNVRKVWLLDNHLHHMSGSAIQMGANTGTEPKISHVFAGRNECHDLWSTGMAAKTSQHIIYSQNHIYNVMDAPGGPSKGIAGQYGATDQWLLYNRIHDCAHGILRVSGNSAVVRLYAIGNVIYDIGPQGKKPNNTGYGQAGIGLWGVNEAYLINNTLSSVANGILTPAVPRMLIENNIIANITNENAYFFRGDVSATNKDVVIRNNLFWQQNGPIQFQLPGEKVMNVNAMNRSDYGADNLEKDPMFVDQESQNFSIAQNSPARAKGLPPSSLTENVYAEFEKQFGLSIERDAAGGGRPKNSTWDIGAYQGSYEDVVMPDRDSGISTPTGLKKEKP